MLRTCLLIHPYMIGLPRCDEVVGALHSVPPHGCGLYSTDLQVDPSGPSSATIEVARGAPLSHHTGYREGAHFRSAWAPTNMFCGAICVPLYETRKCDGADWAATSSPCCGLVTNVYYQLFDPDESFTELIRLSC
jgi:hypothetical protein